MKLPPIVICGPTAVGKSRLALALAQELEGEIISVDSRKLYKYMDIATAKPTEEERSTVPHHLIDLIEPDAQFSAGRFGEEARKAIAQVQRKGKTALLVGGSGLYLKAVVDGLFCGPKASAERREGLKKEAKAFGTASLHQRLKKVDPQAASKIHPHDLVRIIRALEVYEETGKRISSLQSQEKANREIRCLIMIGLDRDRRDLYRRIDQRVESMFSRGLVEEVNDLLRRGYHENLTSMQGL